MIFPDEKMIISAAEDYIKNSHKQIHFISGTTWAINHIKSAASENFEAFWGGYIHAPTFFHTAKESWQAAVISTAAKHEEKLREKDVEIERLKLLHEDERKSRSENIRLLTEENKKLQFQLNHWEELHK